MTNQELYELAALTEAFNCLADRLNGIIEARKGNVRITVPMIGMSVGKCKNCGQQRENAAAGFQGTERG